MSVDKSESFIFITPNGNGCQRISCDRVVVPKEEKQTRESSKPYQHKKFKAFEFMLIYQCNKKRNKQENGSVIADQHDQTQCKTSKQSVFDLIFFMIQVNAVHKKQNLQQTRCV